MSIYSINACDIVTNQIYIEVCSTLCLNTKGSGNNFASYVSCDKIVDVVVKRIKGRGHAMSMEKIVFLLD